MNPESPEAMPGSFQCEGPQMTCAGSIENQRLSCTGHTLKLETRFIFGAALDLISGLSRVWARHKSDDQPAF
jgi:hypothetical protein